MTTPLYTSWRRLSKFQLLYPRRESTGLKLCHSVLRFRYNHRLLCLKFLLFFPVRFIPSWFPGANFKRVAQKAREDLARVEAIPFELAKSQIVHYSLSLMIYTL